MDMSIEKMLSHVYEIEGLMLVTRRLGEENTPDVITNKLKRKVRELADMCGVELVQAPAPAEPVEVSEPSEISELSENSEISEPQAQPELLPDADDTEPEPVVEDPLKVPVEDREPDDDITVEFIEAEDEPEVADDVEEPVEDNEPVVEEKPAEEPVVPEEKPIVMPPVFHLPDDSDEPIPAPDPKVIPEAEDEPDITVEFIEAEDEPLPEPEDEMPIPPVPTEFPETEDTAAPLRVDEKLQRTMSKDIRKAISLNDRFRFQRELFANSANALDTAIEHIEAMRTYGNAELYFFTQLGWDRENEVVQDFMNIVRNHFQQRN